VSHLLLLGLGGIRGRVSSLGCVGLLLRSRGGGGSLGRGGSLRASKCYWCEVEQGWQEGRWRRKLGMARRTDTRDKQKERQRGRTRVREKAAEKSDRDDDCTKIAIAWHLLLLGLGSIRGRVSSLGCVGRGGGGSLGRGGSLRASKCYWCEVEQGWQEGRWRRKLGMGRRTDTRDQR